MNYQDRVRIYRKIEEYRKRPLVVYATSTRPGASAAMASDVVRELIDQLDAVAEAKDVDVLIHSSGGDALAAWKLMSILRERFDAVSVLVPFMAFSAATLFALGADEIVMHPHASLGPIDPQIQAKGPDGQLRQFAYEDVGAFLRFLEEDVRLTEQAHFSSVVDKLFGCVDPLTVGGARRASELSTSIGERLLSTHMDSADAEKVGRIARDLNKSFFAHGDAVSRARARELELKIAADDAALESLMWEAFRALEDAMHLREQFRPDLHFMSDPAAAASLEPLGPLQLPPNAPAPLVQQLWQNAANQAIAGAQAKAPRVPFEHLVAVVESPRAVSEAIISGYITAFRTPDAIHYNRTETKSGWVRYAVASES